MHGGLLRVVTFVAFCKGVGRPAPLGTLRPKDLPVVSGSGVGT